MVSVNKLKLFGSKVIIRKHIYQNFLNNFFNFFNNAYKSPLYMYMALIIYREKCVS